MNIVTVKGSTPSKAEAVEENAVQLDPPTAVLWVGQLCPNCGFARLADDEYGNLRCPVCGYGTRKPCT